MDPEVSWRRGWRFGSWPWVVAGVARRLRKNWIRRRSFEQRCLYRPHGHRDSAVWKLSHRQGDHKVVVPRPIFFDLFLVRAVTILDQLGHRFWSFAASKAWIFRPLSGDGSLPPQPGFKGALWLGALVPASSGYWIYPCWQRDCLISPIYIEKYRLNNINDKYWEVMLPKFIGYKRGWTLGRSTRGCEPANRLIFLSHSHWGCLQGIYFNPMLSSFNPLVILKYL
jgi:hypothetical protein